MGKTQTPPTAALIEAHRVLLGHLHNLEEAAGPHAATSPEEVHRRLELLRTHLAEHFRLEEQGGYLQAVLDRAPHRERLVEHLREEHGELTRLLGALTQQARAAPALDHGLRAQARAWVGRVRAHETQENSLVQDTFNLEIDAED